MKWNDWLSIVFFGVSVFCCCRICFLIGRHEGLREFNAYFKRAMDGWKEAIDALHKSEEENKDLRRQIDDTGEEWKKL